MTGTIARLSKGGYLKVTASRGVVLATGGYAGDLEMMRALNPKDYAANVMLYCSPGAKGDGVRAPHHAGGQMDLTHTVMYFERGCAMPGSKGGDLSTPVPWWMGPQPFLRVTPRASVSCTRSATTRVGSSQTAIPSWWWAWPPAGRRPSGICWARSWPPRRPSGGEAYHGVGVCERRGCLAGRLRRAWLGVVGRPGRSLGNRCPDGCRVCPDGCRGNQLRK